MGSERSRHLFQVTAARVPKGGELGGGYLNTCRNRDASVAEEDVWEFEVTPIMLDVDDPASLFGAADCALWGARADYLLATAPRGDEPVVFHMAALYDIWNITYERPEEPTEYDMGTEFVDWVDWAKVIDFAGTTGPLTTR